MQVPFFRSLRFKVGIGYVVLVALNVGVTVWAIYNFRRLTNALDSILGQTYPNIVAVENMASSIERHEHALSSILNRDVENGTTEFNDAKSDFYQWFQHTNDNRALPEAGPILDNIRSTYDGYLIVTDSLVSLAGGGQFKEAKAFYASIVRPFSQRLSDNCFWL